MVFSGSMEKLGEKNKEVITKWLEMIIKSGLGEKIRVVSIIRGLNNIR
jgi:hypothetical protein